MRKMNDINLDKQVDELRNSLSPLTEKIAVPAKLSAAAIINHAGNVPPKKTVAEKIRTFPMYSRVTAAVVAVVLILGCTMFGMNYFNSSNKMIAAVATTEKESTIQSTALQTPVTTIPTTLKPTTAKITTIYPKIDVNETRTSLIKMLNKEYEENKKNGQLNRTKTFYKLDDPINDVSTAAGVSDENGAGYSETNIQEENVDEGDYIKTDGKYIYAMHRDEEKEENKITIINAKTMSELSKINLGVDEYYSDGKDELYIYNDRLIVINSKCDGKDEYAEVKIYNLSNIKNPKLQSSYRINGINPSTRMIGNILYFSSTFSSFINKKVTKNNYTDFLPIYTVNGNKKHLSINDMCVIETSSFSDFSTMAAIDVTNKSSIKCEAVLGSSFKIYATDKSFYITGLDFGDWHYRTETKIVKFGINKQDFTYMGKCSVDGNVLNQYSMSEYNGFFRIATNNGMSNAVYVLNNALKHIGSIEGIAKGEEILSCRFDGKIAYLVTYKNTDPLFTIDLSNPYSPKVIGKLKVPGFSTYLHKYGNYLIGIGQTDSGDLKISLFNAKDKENVKESDTSVLSKDFGKLKSDCYFSDAQDDPHAFVFNEKTGTLLLTFTASIEIPPEEGEYNADLAYTNGIAVYKISDGKLKLSKMLIEEDVNDFPYSTYNARTLYIDSYYYCLTPTGITRYDSANNYKKVSLKY